MHGRLGVCTGAVGVHGRGGCARARWVCAGAVGVRGRGGCARARRCSVRRVARLRDGVPRAGRYGSTRAAPCCGVVGMWVRPMRLRNTQYVHAWYASTSGSVHSAIQDMISSVYGVELAFSIVRL